MENPFELILERLDRIEKALEKLNAITPVTIDDSLMDINEIAAYLKMAVPSIYGLTHRNSIPHFKIGKKLYFRKDEINKWIFSKRIKTRNDIEEEAMEYIRKNPRRF